MSRSYRKSPCSGITCAASEKEFKQLSSRKVRHNAKQKVRKVLKDIEVADTVVLPGKSRELTETWDGPKDGKVWWDKKSRNRSEEWYKKLMRK
jgi:hypothetical protein